MIGSRFEELAERLAEALESAEEFRRFAGEMRDAGITVPLVANMTEFGKTPLFTLEELRAADVSLALYPLSAFRAMNQAALKVYQGLRKDGTQKNVLGAMQTREELYDFLGYHDYERKLDELFAREKPA